MSDTPKLKSCPTCTGDVKSVWRVVSYRVDYYGKKLEEVEEFSSWESYDEAHEDLPNHATADEHVKNRWHPIGVHHNDKGFLMCGVSHAYRAPAPQVKPLVFTKCGVEWTAYSSVGVYLVAPWLDVFGVWTPELEIDDVAPDHLYLDERAALAEAQKIHERRILKTLER